jgi:ATP-binding cassette subfamily F protein 3
MSLITASGLAKSFGPDDIFFNVALSIPRGARIAIVGPNGVGKTTLLRILVGLDEASSGVVHRARGLTIGYLPQEAKLTAAHSLWEECLFAFADLRAHESELARLEAVMSDPGQAEEALERYGPLQEAFERQGGYTYETRIRHTLGGLGFDEGDFHRPLAQLSGGERTRALLARLLLSDPDLLILDEPTNHLDIAAVEWLEGYLSSWDGTALLVSHDRYFLDRVVDNIWEMSRAGIEVYRGNYSAYVEQRQERWQLRQQNFEAEKERLEKDLDYIRRNIAGQNTLQAKGRLKRLSRYLDAIEKGGFQAVQDRKWSEITAETGASSQMMSLEEVTRRLRALRDPVRRPPILKLNLNAEQRSGEIVLRTSGLVVGYPGEELFRAGDIELRRLECAAVIGPNGAGKTTFLKTILEKIEPVAGEISLGASLQIGYFAQAHEDLNPQRTLVEEIESVAPAMLLADVRDYLARFLFTGEDVFRKVATLSGGERGRLALAKLALMDANLLLLDEPTNHLDIPSQEILQGVLADYQGTIILVSHDRYLIDALASQIWDIDEANQALRVFRGSYSQYRAQRDAERETEEASWQEARTNHRQRQVARPQMSDYQRRMQLNELEEEIAYLENRLAELSNILRNPPSDPQRVQQLGEDYVDVENEINSLLEDWERLQSTQEKIL